MSSFKHSLFLPDNVFISISLCFLIPKLRLSVFPAVSIAECETIKRFFCGAFCSVLSTVVVVVVVFSDLNCRKYFAAKFKYEFLLVDLSKISFSMVCARDWTGVVGLRLSFVLGGFFLSSFKKNVKYSCRVLKGILLTLEFGSTKGWNIGVNVGLVIFEWAFGWWAIRRPSVDVSARVRVLLVDELEVFSVFVIDV